MRTLARFLAVSSVMACSVVALADQTRVLVVKRAAEVGHQWDQGAGSREAWVSREFQWRRWFSLLDLLGVDYTAISGTATKTLWAQTGAQVWNSGTAGAYVEQFGGVMHLDPMVGGSNGTGAYRPDSILRYAYNNGLGGPRVPMLFAWSDFQYIFTAAASRGFVSQNGCSTGVTGTQDGGGLGVYDAAHDIRWELPTYLTSAVVNQNSIAGGLRKLVGQHGNARALNWAGGAGGGCDDCDSLTAEANRAINDSVNVWDRLYSTMPNAYPATFVYDDGNGGPHNDSLYNWNPPDQLVDWASPAEGSMDIKLIALAHWDSIAGHTIFDWNRLPLRRAVTISHLCSRGARFGHHGIHPSDTTVFYATLDSLAHLSPPVPIVFGVNADPDSMLAYRRDLIVASRIPMARFTPELRTGIDTLVAGNGNTSPQRPRDVWGRYRSRAAYGDSSLQESLIPGRKRCAGGADTSLACHLRWVTDLLDSALASIGASGRREPFLLAPDDDWRPLRKAGSPDSVYWVMAMANYGGVVSDGRMRHADEGKNHPNPLGWTNGQGYKSERIGNNTVTVLTHPGYPIVGSSSWLEYECDISSPHDSSGIALIQKELSRAWSAFTVPMDEIDTDVWNADWQMIAAIPCALAGIGTTVSTEDYIRPAVPRGRAYCLRFSANDFSGQTGTAWPNGFPPRNGYWILKSLNTAFDSINRFSGRTLIKFDYPSAVDPGR